ncbi:MAG TPA: exodeoxyribonuclease VII large subunit [Kiritimatiellia bacterium]|nr:exodeoxyribonuclease VII large subunit [Kiritimatiellia bacterium]
MGDEPKNQAPQRKVYRVTELTRRIKAILEGEVGTVWVEGEVSNARTYPSGHIYFTLKDEGAQLSAVMFRGVAAASKTPVKDGAKLRVAGELSVYEQRGQYQLVVRRVEDAGQGELQRAFEELKAKLAAEGLFDAARKRPLPLLPRTIGIVTSSAGAVIRDILNVLGRRYPDRHVLLVPVRVQGAGAAAEIAAALDLLNALGGIDAIIVGRGGGSLEDLWAFNEEAVARAVARSGIPVISAVGHETDFTICDFVADLRAPTPSAAAELVIRPKADYEDLLATQRRRLAQALRAQLLLLRNRYTRAAGSYVFREPEHLLARHRERVARCLDVAKRALESALAERQQRLDEAHLRLGHATSLLTQRTRHRLERAAESLRVLSPHAVLARGYSVTLGPDGRPVLDSDSVATGEWVQTVVARGSFTSVITAKAEQGKPHDRTRKQKPAGNA